jgi:quercetin dioxygenase-like cupin family protein
MNDTADVIHVRFDDSRWIDQGGGVRLAPLRVEGTGAGVAWLWFDEGARSDSHIHPGGEDLYVVSGRIRVGDTLLEAGDFLHTPAGGVHDAEAMAPTLTLISVPEPIEFVDT